MLRRISGRSLCVLLALLLVLTGLGLGQNREAPAMAQESVSAVAAILPMAQLPNRDLYLQKDQQNTIQPVQRARHTSKLQGLRDVGDVIAAAETLRTAGRFGHARYAAGWSGFTAPSWRAIVSLIHRTRRKSC